MILILPITKMFDKIYACSWVCGLKFIAFPCLFCQNSRKNSMRHVLTIFSQKSILTYSLCILSMIENISRARLHYDVIVMSYEDGWYFWYQWKEKT